MSKTNLISCILYLLCCLVLTTCGSDQKRRTWYRGNLHTHSFWSDGDEYPEMIMDWYKSNGYDFVALSDHNILADGEKWIKVPNSSMYQQAFQSYLGKYGPQWVAYKQDSGRTHVKLKAYQEYKYLFEDENFLIIQSEEITDNFEGKPIHLNATNILSFIPPQHGANVADVMQRNIDAVLKQRAETGQSMFPHVNHPNFHYAVSAEDMMALRGERFFEVYNGHPQVNNYGDSAHMSTEVMWDKINLAYALRGQPLLYGLATDDSHNYHQFGAAYSNAGRGWIMVQSDSLSPASLIRAMEEGKFYATTGVILADVSVENNTLHVRVEAEAGVTYAIEFIGVKMTEANAHVVKTEKGTSARFVLSSDYRFIRARITSDKPKPNPFQEGDYEMAWTQPLLIDNL